MDNVRIDAMDENIQNGRYFDIKKSDTMDKIEHNGRNLSKWT